jgi:phage shock protein PspC (stress-responsive transcriptional regulator)
MVDPAQEEEAGAMAQSLTRPTAGRVIAGVCAALAARFTLSATLIRFLFIISLLLPGPQLIIYLVLWILIPSEKKASGGTISN